MRLFSNYVLTNATNGLITMPLTKITEEKKKIRYQIIEEEKKGLWSLYGMAYIPLLFENFFSVPTLIASIISPLLKLIFIYIYISNSNNQTLI